MLMAPNAPPRSPPYSLPLHRILPLNIPQSSVPPVACSLTPLHDTLSSAPSAYFLATIMTLSPGNSPILSALFTLSASSYPALL